MLCSRVSRSWQLGWLKGRTNAGSFMYLASTARISTNGDMMEHTVVASEHGVHLCSGHDGKYSFVPTSIHRSTRQVRSMTSIANKLIQDIAQPAPVRKLLYVLWWYAVSLLQRFGTKRSEDEIPSIKAEED
jgi:hypothetical protein